MHVTRPIAAVAGLALLTSYAAADTPLPRDPNNTYGRFGNGMQYVIRHNANPPGRVNLYLHVKTGALNETDAQNGIAHFLEHMAFNGSTHFPPGRLIPLLAGLGMTFGADTNAHTNLWETVYKLNLPNTKPKTIDLAAQIFGDYASGLSLSDAEIENERKVILEEYRTRQGAGYRIGKRQRLDMYPGTKLATHDVIGDAELIKTFPADQFRKYYDTWYRPENMTLIVVGDVQPNDVLPAAEKWLGSIKARTPATQPDKAGLSPNTKPRAFGYTDTEKPSGEVGLSTLDAGKPRTTTIEQYADEMRRDLATAIVNRRLRNEIAAGHAPFREASVDTGRFLSEATTADASATGEPADWKPMLMALVTEIDRAIEHGFSEGELTLIERGLLADAEQAVKTESTRDSVSIVNDLADEIGTERPLLSAEQRLNLLKVVTGTTNVADLKRVFSNSFNTENFDYVVELPDKPGVVVPTPADVLATATAAWKVDTQAPTDAALAETILEQEPTPGAVASTSADAELGVTTTAFADGVVLHHKFSDYKKDTVLVSITLPGGQIEETAANRGVSELAGVILDRPATGRFTSTQLADLLTGKNVSLDGSVGRDTLTIKLTASRADLPIGMQLANALLTGGKLESSAVEDWKKKRLQGIAANERRAQGQLQKELARTVYAGDPRFTPLTAANVNALTAEQAQAWFDRIAKSAAVEVAVVGDISADDAKTLVAQYVASLPKRQKDFDALDGLRKLDRGPGPFTADESFDSQTPQALAVGGFISCDETSPDRRPLAVAAEVLTNRMIERIREKENLVYSIDADNSPARGVPGTGLFTAGSMTDPANGEKLAATVNEMIGEFAKTGPTAEELATAKKQIMTEVTTAMREPGWWMGQIAELKYRGRKLDELKQVPAVFDTFSADDLKTVVAKYAKPDSVLSLIATPKTLKPTTKPAS